MSTFSIENEQLSFEFTTGRGLKCTSVLNRLTGEEWLTGPCAPFVLEVEGVKYPADDFILLNSGIISDAVDQVLVFEMVSPVWNITVRLSVSVREECLVFLVQAKADWEGAPKEVYLHIPLFREFTPKGKWQLSANPRPKPDGTAAIEIHPEFPLPVCHIDQETGHGIMMELPDHPEFTGTWNQNRNRVLLQMTGIDEFLSHILLLRLQNRQLADVAEIHFSALERGYKEAFFRFKGHIREGMDLSMYEKEDLKWYRKALYHNLAFAYSREIFNYETGEFEIDRLLDDGEEFGGYDILVLWFVYPRLGVDARKQWDFCNDIPGGLEGVNEICRQAHRRGVRVMLPYNPWDADEDESLRDTLDHVAKLVEETDIDGVWFDTMDSVPPGCRERIENIRPGVICCLEVTPKIKETVESITGSWNQRFCMPEGHILRYLFPEHAAPVTSRWRVEKKKDLLVKRAIFNGTGFAVWQDVFGAWLPFDEKQKADLKRWKEILLANYDTYFGKDCMPLYPVLQDAVYVNVFYNDDGLSEIYSVYNASRETVTGPLFCIEDHRGENWELNLEELWEKDESFVRKNEIISGILEPEKIYILKTTRRKKG